MSVADYAAENDLHRVGARPPLHRYLLELWQRRDFAISMAKYKIEAENQKNRLGLAWIGLRPILNAVIYGFVFGLLQGANRPDNFAAFIIVGVFLFEFFSNSLSGGSRAIVNNTSLVQSLAFPRMTLPLATVIQQLMNLLVILGVMGIILLVLGEPPRVSWFLVVPLVIIMTVFNTGVALIMARWTAGVQDLSQLIPLITRVFFYTSGVFFSIETVLAGYPTVIAIFDFNPIYEFLVIGRGALLNGYAIPPEYWLFSSIWAVLLVVVGTFIFWSAEESYGRVD